jgi:hypothetical protein
VEGEAAGFDTGYYAHLLEKAWDEVAFTLDRVAVDEEPEAPGTAGMAPSHEQEERGFVGGGQRIPQA